MTREEHLKIVDAVIDAHKDNEMGGKYAKAFNHGVQSAFNRVCEALNNMNEQPCEDTLDKIRAEIERKAHSGQWSDATIYGMLKAVAIIDKYREGGAE